jgi:hypothetical protein
MQPTPPSGRRERPRPSATHVLWLRHADLHAGTSHNIGHSGFWVGKPCSFLVRFIAPLSNHFQPHFRVGSWADHFLHDWSIQQGINTFCWRSIRIGPTRLWYIHMASSRFGLVAMYYVVIFRIHLMPLCIFLTWPAWHLFSLIVFWCFRLKFALIMLNVIYQVINASPVVKLDTMLKVVTICWVEVIPLEFKHGKNAWLDIWIGN